MACKHFRKPARDTVIAIIHEAGKSAAPDTADFWMWISDQLGVDHDQLSDLLDEYGIVIPLRVQELEPSHD